MEDLYRISNRIDQARRLAMSAAIVLTFGSATATVDAQVDVVAEVGHQRPLKRMTYSADGRWLMTSGRQLDGTTRLWLDGRLRHVLPGGRGAMPPSGRFVVTGSEDNSGKLAAIRLWDVATGQLRWEALDREVRNFAVTPDGTRLLATGSRDQSLQVWDTETGEVRQRLADRVPPLSRIIISPLGTWAATWSLDVMIWELEAGRVRCWLSEKAASARQLSFAPQERFLVAIGGGAVQLFNPENCELQHRFETDDERLGRAVVSPDGAYVLASSSRRVWLWHRESGKVVYEATELDPCRGFSAIAFHPSGDWAAISRTDGQIDLVVPELGAQVHTLMSSFGPNLLVPRPDGSELAAGQFRVDFIQVKDGSVRKLAGNSHLKITAVHLSQDAEQLVIQNTRVARIWDLASGQPPIVVPGARSIATLDGSIVAVGPSDHQAAEDLGVKIWQRASQRILTEIEHPVRITTFALDPAGKALATGAEDGSVQVWEPTNGRLVQQLQGPAVKVNTMVLIEEVLIEEVSSETSQAVVAGFQDGSLWVWELGASEPRAVLPGPEGRPIWRLVALPTRGAVIAQDRYDVTHLWNHSQQRLIGQLGERSSVKAVAATGDGRFAVMGRFRRDLSVWSVENDQALFTFQGHTGLVQALAVDLHGGQFLTGDVGGALSLWSTQDGRLKSSRQVSPIGISAIVPHPEGRFVILGDHDGGVRFWSLANQREIVRVLMHAEGVWAVLTPDGRWDASGAGRDAGIVAWSGLEPGYLAEHPEHFVPGLLAKALRPYLE
ncbi:MAG: WD40 repeat domain-containing protein [Acidobacteriota bacterium]